MRIFRPNIKKMLKNGDVNSLIKALSHQSIDVVVEAKSALCCIGSPAVEPLIEAVEVAKRDVVSPFAYSGSNLPPNPLKVAGHSG